MSVGALYDFIHRYQWIYDLHLTKYLVDDMPSRIPEEWICALNDSTIATPSSLKEFVHSARALLVEASYNDTQLLKPIEISKVMRKGMKVKKQHEVSLMASRVQSLCAEAGIAKVVDVGAGLGHLGQTLARHFGYDVIGIEGDTGHSNNARKRAIHNGVTNYKTIEFKFSDDDDCILNFVKILEENNFTNGVALVGLHACADLTPMILRLFDAVDVFRLLVVVPCCYYNMATDDRACGVEGMVAEYRNFPMSRTLTLHGEGRKLRHFNFALRLATQHIDWNDKSEKQKLTHVKFVFYRSVVELYLHNEGKKMNKLNQKIVKTADCTDFFSYISSFDERTDILRDDKYGNQKLQALYNENEHLMKTIGPFTYLQTILQTIVELAILEDRRCYLDEKGYEASIERIFNPTMSPRNIAIVAYK